MDSIVVVAESLVRSPLRVGLVGTGYAAKVRAESFQADPRSRLVGVVGHTPERTDEFAQIHQTEAFNSWPELLEQADIDLLVIANINQLHGQIARAALEAGKHLVVEYPLALDWAEAEAIAALAQAKGLLLHVEHIELLGGLHQTLLQHLPSIGAVFYIRYATVMPQRPAPKKWTYNTERYGFPFIAALSRIHRLTHTFGSVAQVSCSNRYWDQSGQPPTGADYATCICTLHLQFTNGLLAHLTYGKGESVWQSDRRMEVHGSNGALIFDGDEGVLINAGGQQRLEMGGRRGLFAKDTTMVLDHLFNGSPLYVQPQSSLYALRVAEAARQSAVTGQVVTV